MNTWLMLSAGVLALLAVAHSIIGERLLIGPLTRRDDLPGMRGDGLLAKRTLRFAWHITSAFGLGVAALLIVLARSDDDVATPARIIALTLAASGLLALVIARGRHPAWILFFVAAVLAWLGST